MSSRRLALVLAFGTLAVLLAMVVVGLTTGASQEAHEHYQVPDEYARTLLAHPNPLRLLFGLDIGFLVLYTAFFAAFAHYLRALGRPFTHLALGAMVLTALLDIVEDHHIAALLTLAEHGRPISDSSIVFEDVLSQSKFTVSFISLVMFGLAVPRTSKLAWALALFLTVGTVVTAIAGYATPPETARALENGRWLGFLVGFGIAIAWLRTAPDEPATSPRP
jgi:hypothetical protein